MDELQSYLAPMVIEGVQSYPTRIPFTPEAYPLEGVQSYLALIGLLGLVALAVQNDLSEFVDDEEDDSSHSDTGEDDADESRLLGIIYARVSSRRQADEGNSLREQVQNLQRIAEERGIDLVEDPIRDAGKTGTNFDREGIRHVRSLALQGEIDYVLIDDVDRVGRHAAETIFYLYELRTTCGVTVITAQSGELDVTDFKDLVAVMLKSLMSQMTNELRARRAQNGRIEEFEQGNWTTYYNTAPLGYRLTEDDWLELDSAEAETVRQLFETFLEVDIQGAYSRTTDRVEGFSGSSHRLKVILQARVYIGEPGVDAEHPDTGEPVFVEDSDLEIVDEEVFEQAQEKIERVNERYSSNSNGTQDLHDVDDFVDQFGPVAVDEACEMVRLQCRECGGDVVKNGQRTLANRRVHNYKCKECGRQRKCPTEDELDQMRAVSA